MRSLAMDIDLRAFSCAATVSAAAALAGIEPVLPASGPAVAWSILAIMEPPRSGRTLCAPPTALSPKRDASVGQSRGRKFSSPSGRCQYRSIGGRNPVISTLRVHYCRLIDRVKNLCNSDIYRKAIWQVFVLMFRESRDLTNYMANDIIDLSQGMNGYRVVDRQAIFDSASEFARIQIAKNSVIRRVIVAPTTISLIQECGGGLQDLDRWQSEGDATTADNTWTMVALYSGDVKCSASTWWNTGNPRHLLERWVRSVDFDKIRGRQVGPPLWEWLANRFERCTYLAPDLPPAQWFRGSWVSIRDAIETFLGNGRSLVGDAVSWSKPPKDPRSMVYIMSETGTDWVKVGTCKGNGTSPPTRRRGMYQPANKREIFVMSAWAFTGRNPELAMKQILRKYCRANGIPNRSEWFCIGGSLAIDLVQHAIKEARASLIDEEAAIGQS
jgi:hypothetical protein